jgi:hypothetical protein
MVAIRGDDLAWSGRSARMALSLRIFGRTPSANTPTATRLHRPGGGLPAPGQWDDTMLLAHHRALDHRMAFPLRALAHHRIMGRRGAAHSI